jgi:hypothetical protein
MHHVQAGPFGWRREACWGVAPIIPAIHLSPLFPNAALAGRTSSTTSSRRHSTSVRVPAPYSSSSSSHRRPSHQPRPLSSTHATARLPLPAPLSDPPIARRRSSASSGVRPSSGAPAVPYVDPARAFAESVQRAYGRPTFSLVIRHPHRSGHVDHDQHRTRSSCTLCVILRFWSARVPECGPPTQCHLRTAGTGMYNFS